MDLTAFPMHEMEHLALVALAAALGAIVGVEREFADKPAGLRTHMFVCAASTMLMLLGDAVLDRFQMEEGGSGLASDPMRIIQAIVVGISFLGAGTIIHQGNQKVEGLTTAASILMTSCVGIAVAVRQFVLAGGTAILVVLTLIIIGWLEAKTSLSRSHSSDRDPDLAD